VTALFSGEKSNTEFRQAKERRHLANPFTL